MGSIYQTAFPRLIHEYAARFARFERERFSLYHWPSIYRILKDESYSAYGKNPKVPTVEEIQKWVEEIDEEEPPEEILPPPNIVSRDEWGARSSLGGDREVCPVPSLGLLTDTDTDSCFNKEECMSTMRAMQSHHMDTLGEPDIQFSFVIAEDGNVYEGRGWNKRSSKHLNSQDRLPHRYDLAFIGRHDPQKIPETLRMALKQLLQFGRNNNYISEEFILADVKDKENIFIYPIGKINPVKHFGAQYLEDKYPDLPTSLSRGEMLRRILH